MAATRILVVDDETEICGLVKDILEDEGYDVAVATDGETARRARVETPPELVLLDIWMPDVDGITLMREWSEGGDLPFPVVVMSGHGTVETAVEATRLGAYDFLEKPLSLAKLLLTVSRALEANRLRRENEGLRRQMPPAYEPIGRSPAIRALRDQVERVAGHDTWVLIGGEPGTGKETLARYLHSLSGRSAGGFIAMNVAAMPSKENTATEIFGCVEADRIYRGSLEQATGGTLFIDDVADMDFDAQTALSSALERGSFMRVGGSEPVSVDVRVIAATQRDLSEDVRRGRFREELYYQLNVVPLKVPPLRERREDVPDLLRFYVDYFPTRDSLPYRRFTVAAQNRLRNYHWPGNVRELQNLVQRLLILGSDEAIDVAEVDQALGAEADDRRAEASAPAPNGAAATVYDLPLREAREQFERDYLMHQLQETGGSVGKLAKVVGMERTHLYRKLRALGVDPKKASKGQ